MSIHKLDTRTLLLTALAGTLATSAFAQDTIDDAIARYQFNGDLTNDSTATALLTNLPSPDGIFREGNVIATATAGTAAFATGWNGLANSAISLDGVDDWVDIGTDGFPNVFNPSGRGIVAGTFSAWINSTDSSHASHILGIRNNSPQQAMLFGVRGDGTIYVFPRADNSSVSRFIVGSDPTATPTYLDGTWHHIAVQWDGDLEAGSGVPTLAGVYLDGQRLPVAPTNYFLDSTDAQAQWNLPVAIGGRSAVLGGVPSIDQLFGGLLDDLRIFDRALSDQEVADMVGDYTGGLDGIGGSDIDTLFSNFGTVTSGLKKFDLDEDGTIGTADADIWVNFLARTDYGDVDLDGTITNTDLATAQSNLGNPGGWNDGDITGDGQVTQDDINIILAALGPIGLAGDYNASGSVEQGDLDLVLNNWGGPRTAGFVANADGFSTANVDQEELDRVLNNWGSSNAPGFNGVSVPEPATLAVLGGLGLVGLRRRHA